METFSQEQPKASGKENGEVEITRRGFLKGVLGVAAVGAVTANTVIGSGLQLEAAATNIYRKREFILNQLRDAQYESDATVQSARLFLKEAYGLDVINGETSRLDTVGDNLSQGEFIDALLITIEEFEKYPLDFFEKNEIKKINLVKNLSDYVNGQRRENLGGKAFQTDASMIVEYDPLKPSSVMRLILHHEIVHIVDIDSKDRNFDWVVLHMKCDCGFYGEGKFNKKDAEVNPYFISSYGETHPSEERAVFGEFMMIPELHRALLKKVSSDKPEASVLLSKYEDMKKYYLDWSDGSMDEAYWGRLLKQADSVDGADGEGAGGPGLSKEDMAYYLESFAKYKWPPNDILHTASDSLYKDELK